MPAKWLVAKMIAKIVGSASKRKMLESIVGFVIPFALHSRVFDDGHFQTPIRAPGLNGKRHRISPSDRTRFFLSSSLSWSVFSRSCLVAVEVVPLHVPPIDFYLNCSMNLRSHLDRFCGLTPMEPDHHPRQRSRSPQQVHTPPRFRLSPFFAPPGWQPPPPRPDRAVILQIDLRPMQQLALLDNYYDILAPQVYTHLTTVDYRSAFILYKSSTPITSLDTTSKNFMNWSSTPS